MTSVATSSLEGRSSFEGREGRTELEEEEDGEDMVGVERELGGEERVVSWER